MPNPTATDGTVKNAYFAVFFEFSMKIKAGEGFEPDPFATIIPFTDAVHECLAKATPALPINRVDDFPGASHFEMCVNDGETEEVDVFGVSIGSNTAFTGTASGTGSPQRARKRSRRLFRPRLLKPSRTTRCPTWSARFAWGKPKSAKRSRFVGTKFSKVMEKCCLRAGPALPSNPDLFD